MGLLGRHPLLLRNIRRDLIEHKPLSTEQLHDAFSSLPAVTSLADRVVATIFGMP